MSRITVRPKDSRHTVVVGFCRYLWNLTRDGFFGQVWIKSKNIKYVRHHSAEDIYESIAEYVDLTHTTSREVMEIMKAGYAPHEAFICEDEDIMLDVSKYPHDESFHTRANE